MISIVIPVYNLEKYIGKCLESVLGQTYTDYEVIVVNDGSSDNSYSVIESYLPQFPSGKFQIINKPQNGGVTAARRDGFLAAKGDWVCFVDGDDMLPADSLEILSNDAAEGVSIVCGSYIRFKDNDTASICSKRILTKGTYPYKEAFYMMMLNMSKAVWGRIYKKEKIKPKMFDIPKEIMYREDAIFNYLFFSNNDENVILTDKIIYNHRVERNGSVCDLMEGRNKLNLSYEIRIFKILDEIIARTPYIDTIREDAFSTLYMNFLWQIHYTMNTASAEDGVYINAIFNKIKIRCISTNRLKYLVKYFVLFCQLARKKYIRK